jgi:lysine 6-dehydrogenase
MSFRRKGVREVSFKINYEPELVDLVRSLDAVGFTARDPVAVNGTQVSPRSVLLALLSRQAPQKPARDVEALRVVVVGRERGRHVANTIEAWTRYTVQPPLSAVARDTGFPASIAAQMLGRGEIHGTGVAAPENVVPPVAFFQELAKRDIRVRRWRTAPSTS